MDKPKKKKSVVPSYVFGVTWLLCLIVLDFGFFESLLIAYIVRFLIKSVVSNRDRKKNDRPTKKADVRSVPKFEEKGSSTNIPKEEPVRSTGNPELDAVLREGRESVERIQQINDAIPDFKLSAKLKQIEVLTASIIDQVERKPDKLKEVRQFINYYLPTTIKLLDQYVQLQNVGLRGENIESGMQQIEELLDKVIVAFQKQLDSLFERDVVDITSDIQVMEQMMAAQGLTNNNDFA